jgi:hypothetical protein
MNRVFQTEHDPDASHLLPLEGLLRLYQRGHNQRFPVPGIDYFRRYQQAKEWLANNVYKYIGAMTSAKEGAESVFTDHGIDHFDRVIKYAGALLDLRPESTVAKTETGGDAYKKLDPYEVFLLLMAILLHDAGNAYGRQGHEKRAFRLLGEMGANLVNDNFERRLIADLAEVHGGSNERGGKDTIGAKQWKDKMHYLDTDYRPKLIAAIVRFADEVCEDRTRTPNFLLGQGVLPSASRPYHYYAEAICSSRVDTRDKSILLSYQIPFDRLFLNKGGDDGEEETLVDVIVQRLAKMDKERRYCDRYMSELVQIRRIRANLAIVNEDYEADLEANFVIQDEGYPGEDCDYLARFRREHEDWCPHKLSERYKRG